MAGFASCFLLKLPRSFGSLLVSLDIDLLKNRNNSLEDDDAHCYYTYWAPAGIG